MNHIIMDYKSKHLHSLYIPSHIRFSMASSLHIKPWLLLVVVLCIATTCCKSDGDPVGIVDKALECFNDRYVYSSCQEDYRLKAEGDIHVPPEATDEYCDGPCLSETKLLLKCIDNILFNFKFYNGASIQDVKHTLLTGCSHSDKRGDFDVLENLGLEGYGEYDHGNKLTISVQLLMILGAVLLLWR